MNFPIEYQVVEQLERQPNLLRTILSLRLGKRRLYEVPPGFVLIRMARAPLNPSDIAFLQGAYKVRKSYPAVPGFEGAGTVVAVGEGVQQSWLSKRVACFAGNETDGTWAEYVLAREYQLVEVDDQLSWDTAATFLVNPFTAYAMFQQALSHHTKAIAINAAGSSVAFWLRKLAKMHGLTTINVVRKAETKDKLLADGYALVLLSSHEHFEAEFRRLTFHHDCRLAFDAVAGTLGGQMLNAMPENSTLVVYGGLSNQPLGGFDVLELIFGGKKIHGFDLYRWWSEASPLQKQSISQHFVGFVKSGEAWSEVSAVFGIKDLVQALRHYLGNMSGGKVLLRLDEV